MHPSDQLSIKATLEYENHGGEKANRFERGPIQALSQPLPFSIRIRNGLFFLLLLAVVALFWQPLVSLFSLTQEQEHQSHIVLIPCLSLYVLYLDRKAIFASRKTANIASATVPARSQWKPLSKSLPHLGS